MSATFANPLDSFAGSPEDASLRKFLAYSAALHALIAGAIVVSIYFHWAGNAWGGVGGASEGDVKVNLVGSAGIPMPQPPVVSESHTFDPTESLYKAQPQPKPPEVPKDATPIPKFEKEKPPKQIEHKSRTFDDKTPPPPNAANYGQGGRPKIETGYSQTPGAPSAGVAVAGQGGGDFASRYGWYIESVRRLINQNWLQSTIDPAVRAQRTAHCVVTFTIQRDGKVTNIQISQSSGNLSMDNSAKRALLSVDRMQPLPGDYSGSYVNVTFDFDLAMSR